MSGITEEARIKLVIDGNLANAPIKEMARVLKEAKKALDSLSADDPKRKQLSEDFKKLSEEFNKQRKEVYGTTSAMDKLNDTIEKSVTQYGQLTAEMKESNKQSMDAVNQLSGQVGGATGQVISLFRNVREGVSTGVRAFNTLRGAIAATGIGLLILAISTLVGWFKKTDEGAMVLDGIMRALGAIVDILFKRLVDFGKSIYNFFSEPKKAMKEIIDFLVNNFLNQFKAFLVIWEGIKNMDLKKATDGVIQLTTGIENATDKAAALGEEARKLGQEIADAAREGMELARVFDDLDERRRAMELYNSQAELEVSRYLKQSQNVGKSLHERLELLQKADAIETGNMAVKIRYQEDMIAAIRRENALKEKSGTLMDEDLDKLNEALIARNQAEMESQNLQEKIANRRAQLIEKQRAEFEKLEAERKRQAEKEQEDVLKLAQMKDNIDKIRHDALKKQFDEIEENGKRNLDAAKMRMYEEGKTAEWLAQREKEIALSVAQQKLQAVRLFGEEELAFEVEVAAAKDNISKAEEQRLHDMLQKEADSWYNYYQSQLEIAAKNAHSEDERLQLKIEQIELAAQKELETVGNNAMERKRIEAETDAAIEQARSESEARKLQMISDTGNQALGYARQLTASLTTIENSKLTKQRQHADLQKKELERQLNAEKLTKEQYNAQVQAIDENMAKEQGRVARQQAMRDKVTSIAEIGFSTATAIMKAVEMSPATFGLPWSAVIGGIGAVQTAAVLSTPLPAYYSGGFLPRSFSDSTQVPMIGHANEYMVDARSLRDPYVMNTIGLVEAAKAQGTTPSSIIERNSSTVYSNTTTGSTDDIRELVALLKQGITHKFEIDDEAGFKLNRLLKKQQEFDDDKLI